MKNRNRKIRIENFTERKNIKRDFFVPLCFLVAFLILGLFEKNLILPGNGYGLFQHINIWIFLTMNMIIPVIIKKSFSTLNCNIDERTSKSLKKIFAMVSNLKLTKVLWHFSKAVGFCCFIGNTLQNAKIINQLPFDYWDSISYPFSYIVSRGYKLYLFVLFFPSLLVYAYTLIRSVSKLVVIDEAKKYPIANYTQIKALCNFGLNVLIMIILPVLFSSVTVYLVHDRFDITTITTIVVCCACTIASLIMYLIMIKKFYVSLSDYKREHVMLINDRLAIIHQFILDSQKTELDSRKLEMYLKEEEYLCRVKEDIEKKSKFPHAFKALITSVAPLLPTIYKIIPFLGIPFLS